MSQGRNLKFDTRPFLALLTGLLLAAGPLHAQDQAIAPESASIAQSAVVPQTIRYSGMAQNRTGDAVEAVFRIYAAREGGEPLWSETQRVTIAADGRYTVLLGSAGVSGLPQTVFAAGQARWLGVSIERDEEQPRTLLASVAYAMKAADAETLAGRAAAQFVTQEQLSATAKALAAQATELALPEATLSGSGTADYLPLWSSSSALGDSILFQAGTTKIGIATKTPATTLDVDGATTLRGTVSLPPAGSGTASSPMLELSASVSAVAQNFAWRAVAATSANLELLFASGSTAPAATGLAISPKGILTFARGQTFPGTGPGTITGVTAGKALTGGGTTGSITLNVDTTKVPLLSSANTFAGSNTFSSPIKFAAGQTFPGTGPGTITGVAAGTALTGGGTTGSITLNVDTTKVPLLSSANTFAGSNTFSNPVTFAAGQTFPGTGTITGVTASAPLTGGGTSGALTLGLNTATLETTLNSVYPQLGVANTFTKPITFAAGQTFPGTGTITGVTASAPLTGGGTSGALTLGLNTATLETTLNGVYPQLGAANTFTKPITFAAGQTFPGSGTITGVTAGTALTGGGTTGAVTVNVDTTKIPQLTAANTFTGNQTFNSTIWPVTGAASATSGLTWGVAGSVNSPAGYGVYGFSFASGGIGVYGDAPSTGATTGVQGNGFAGVEGSGQCCSGGTDGGVGVIGSGLLGIEGVTNGPENATPQYGWGVVGNIATSTGDFSAEGTTYSGTHAAGVWGDDTGAVDGAGVMATADTASALLAVNNTTGTNSATIKIYDYTKDTHDPLFETYAPNTYTTAPRNCVIDTSANLECSGLVEGQVSPDVDGTVRAMYAMQSSEVWFEDFGSSTLHSGSAHVSLEPIFAGSVNSGVEYHVFLTPKGDCEGLYVANEGPGGFDVRELRHGKSSVGFDYRIVAKRKGYEMVRMEDQTAQYEARKAREDDLARRMAEVAAHPAQASPRRMLRSRPAMTPAPISQGLALPEKPAPAMDRAANGTARP